MNSQPPLRPDLVNTDDADVVYTQTKTVNLDQALLENNRILAFNKARKESALFDLLRTQILQKMEENNWKSIAVVSPSPECGKTFISINLAISIAQQPNKSALLVDFDLRRPKVATYLGLKETYSLNDYFSGKKQFNDILINPGIPKLVVAATNKSVLKSSELLSTDKARQFIREARDRYESRILVVDLPPILAVDDPLVVLPQIDCVLLVIGSGVNSRKEILEAKRKLANFNLIGVVLNKADTEDQGYYYY
ncbi:CpsD/CapB family tyrosine-protein kinase [Methylophilus aquaticus]|uniref:CpsD/CapB family tyrosine-protein kinase n=1 Tax=Methylophilus aquaticus TaxID=1971610 RepID=A0ABT9JT42_9PROT|nr:CpsD/CapB family tyrosine-protein kinase [Methylophilus aquaticus]MDP8567752.1 CpsD/CapB family tyrosine-protein kinase [Methylophilus aquaticus]